jgi:hypothetical protein
MVSEKIEADLALQARALSGALGTTALIPNELRHRRRRGSVSRIFRRSW